MQLLTHSPKKALKAFLKQKPLRSDMDTFKANLIQLLDKISLIESQPKDETEEHLKNNLRDFLRDTYYKTTNAINTKDKKDLVLHVGKETSSEVGVIIEAKRPNNTSEMISPEAPNKKAFHELVLYYLNERHEAGNSQLKQLVITNINEWYIIDANYFDKYIYRNTAIKKLYETKRNDRKDNPFFYEELAKLIEKSDAEIPCVYFNIKDYETILRNADTADDKELIALYKILAPQYLLKVAAANDSNSLNAGFYRELLHVIGLEEAKEGGKNIIRRKLTNRNGGSLLELTIDALNTENVFHRVSDLSIYGSDKEERTFNIALELCITWVNRVLFLKLLEGQLLAYHQGDKSYRFLNFETIHNFDELFKLFHKVLAVNISERSEAVNVKYKRIPYLNSSLFDISELEDQAVKINSLDNDVYLDLYSTSVLKDPKKRNEKMLSVDYLLTFLDAYDFSSEGAEEVQEDNKPLINASVLGKVFEKINGYKDGSIFTPAFITMYMCRQSIRAAVLQKFNAAYSEGDKPLCDTFEELCAYTNKFFKAPDILKANELVNSLKICDPAVGSGHFLVSALNELIAIKSELGILADEKGALVKHCAVEIIDDELYVFDHETGQPFKYTKPEPFNAKVSAKIATTTNSNTASNISEKHRVQKMLFSEKQAIIENCLFGVDINPKSVAICRLRLWIELLKNAYYKEETNFEELETLPNIDINIKCGNSLLSRFTLDADLSKALKSIKYDIKAYRGFVSEYKSCKNREAKKGLSDIIDRIKNDFRTEINKNDPKKSRLAKLAYELYNRFTGNMLFEPLEEYGKKTPKAKDLEKKRKEEQTKLELDIDKLKKEIDEVESNKIYKNAFEWRFEFPEVLDNNGNFVGFDIVIANPPYIRQEELGVLKVALEKKYSVFISGGDIFSYFYELSANILKEKGTLAFINNTFDKTTAGKSLRSYLASNFDFKKYIDFTSVVVFDEATTYPIILIAERTKNFGSFGYFKFTKETFATTSLIYDESIFANINQSALNHAVWNFLDESEHIIISKIQKNKQLNDIYGKCYRGIITGLNEAFVTDKNLGDYLELKPVYDGKDLKKWITPAPTKQMIVFKSKTSKERYGNVEETLALQKMKADYPTIMAYLTPFEEQAKKRYDKGDFWWELRNCAYYDLFDKPKIVFPNLQNANKFALDLSGTFLNAPAVFLPSNDKALLAILNSKVVWHFLKSICVVRNGGFIEVKPQYFEQIPIPVIEEKEHKELGSLVDKILAAKKDNQDTLEYEKQIDKLVYTLYELNADEIKIIEDGN